jgi:hypothetical protein
MHPLQLGDLRARADRGGVGGLEHRHPKDLGFDEHARLVGGGGEEGAERFEGIRRDDEPELFVQLAREGLRARLAGLVLAAGLHEHARAGLAHQQEPAAIVDDECRRDADHGLRGERLVARLGGVG